MRVNGKCMVPCRPLADLMRKWAKEKNLDRKDPLDFKRNMSWERTLAQKSGINRRKLYAILSGEQKHVQFDLADRLMCAMDLNHMWYEEPLSKYYGPIEVSKFERRRSDMFERFRPGARWRVRVAGHRIYTVDVEVVNVIGSERLTVICRDLDTGKIRRYARETLISYPQYTYLGHADELAAVA